MAKRDDAIRRGLAFIYASACDADNFHSYGADYLCCFYCISATSRDRDLRKIARALGRDRAGLWRRQHSDVSSKTNADGVADLVFGNDAADRLGVRDAAFKDRLREIARQYNSHDYLSFDPLTEPPPADVPAQCDCGSENLRGRKNCHRCKRTLDMNSAYWVWFMAITRTYTGERHGVRLGAPFAAVLKWISVMRPYPQPDINNGSDFYWAIYAVTHIIYALNDYSTYQLSPAWLPDEYAFLKRNISEAITMEDPDVMGEVLDSLKSFGLCEDHPLIKKGVRYLLANQNEDGSWGNLGAADVYERYHPTWTAIDGLRDYAWRGKRLSLKRMRPLLS